MPRVNGGQVRKNKQAVKESPRLLYLLCMLCLLPWKQTGVGCRPAEQGRPRRSDRGVPTAPSPKGVPKRHSPGNLLAFFFVLPLRGHAKTDGRGGASWRAAVFPDVPALKPICVSPAFSWSVQPADNETHLRHRCPRRHACSPPSRRFRLFSISRKSLLTV